TQSFLFSCQSSLILSLQFSQFLPSVSSFLPLPRGGATGVPSLVYFDASLRLVYLTLPVPPSSPNTVHNFLHKYKVLPDAARKFSWLPDLKSNGHELLR